MLAAGGFSAGFINVKVIGFFQMEISESDRGSFFATLQAYVGGSQPFSYLAFSALLTIVSANYGFMTAGLGLVSIGAYCLYKKSQKKYSA